jgi:transcriptional regulator of acetoin/glycerol metabolism
MNERQYREARQRAELRKAVGAVAVAYGVTADQLIPPPEGSEVYAARRSLTHALERCGWSRAEIARQFGVSRTAITTRLRGFEPTTLDARLVGDITGES